MEVILIEDMKGVGTKGSTVNVKPGLRAQLPAAAPARHHHGDEGREPVPGARAPEVGADRQADRRGEDRGGQARRLPVNIPAQANEEDTLFGSITNTDVADALKAAGHAVDKRRVEMDEHIKQLGNYDVTVRYYGGVTATVKVWVVRA